MVAIGSKVDSLTSGNGESLSLISSHLISFLLPPEGNWLALLEGPLERMLAALDDSVATFKKALNFLILQARASWQCLC